MTDSREGRSRILRSDYRPRERVAFQRDAALRGPAELGGMARKVDEIEEEVV